MDVGMWRRHMWMSGSGGGMCLLRASRRLASAGVVEDLAAAVSYELQYRGEVFSDPHTTYTTSTPPPHNVAAPHCSIANLPTVAENASPLQHAASRLRVA